MFRTTVEYISDEEFETIVSPFDDFLDEYVKENFLNEFVALYIAEGYKRSAIWKADLPTISRTATEMLAQFCEKDCDYNKIKDILEKEYCLKVINETPIEVEELRTE